MTDYFNPEALVSTQWVADHLNDANVRLLEVGWDTSEYESGHVPNAVAGWGFPDVQRPDSHDIPDKRQIESMLSEAGVANEDTIVLYGGLNNLPAALAFWVLNVYGHADVRLLDGGRRKWLAESRPLTTEKPFLQPTQYIAQTPNLRLRADKKLVADVIAQASHTLVDARSEEMYKGEVKAGGRLGGHIPTAINVPAQRLVDAEGNSAGWQTPSTNSDGTFKSVEELRSLFSEKGIIPDENIITYCVVGGLSSHMWFTLTQLLGYPNVREYDLSWKDWANGEDVPIEK